MGLLIPRAFKSYFQNFKKNPCTYSLKHLDFGRIITTILQFYSNRNRIRRDASGSEKLGTHCPGGILFDRGHTGSSWQTKVNLLASSGFIPYLLYLDP